MKTVLTQFILTLMMIAISCSPKPEIPNEEALVDSLLAEVIVAWNSGNPDQIVDLFTEEGIMIFPNITVSGRDSLYKFAQMCSPNMINFTASSGIHSVSEDLIMFLGPYSYDWKGKDDKLYPQQGCGNLYWEKNREGKWKIFLEVDHQAGIVPLGDSSNSQ